MTRTMYIRTECAADVLHEAAEKVRQSEEN